jgi:hypothetical protein
MEIAYGVIVTKKYYLKQISIHDYGKIDFKRLAIDTWNDASNEIDPDDILEIIREYGGERKMEKYMEEKPEQFLIRLWPSIPGVESILLSSGKLFVGFFDGWHANVLGGIGMTKEDINKVDRILAEYGLDQEDPNVYIGSNLQASITNTENRERIE